MLLHHLALSLLDFPFFEWQKLISQGNNYTPAPHRDSLPLLCAARAAYTAGADQFPASRRLIPQRADNQRDPPAKVSYLYKNLT